MNKLKILQIVKTTDGAQWALEQVKVLIELGHDLHVILNSDQGKFIDQWKESGAQLYYQDLDFPIKKPLSFFQRVNAGKDLISKINPDIIHSHFFGTTIVMRSANKKSKIPFVFQIPGPLHLENILFRTWELLTAKEHDYWIPSSQYIKSLYLSHGINSKRLYTSYYGSLYDSFSTERNSEIREKAGFQKDDFLVGSVSYIYAPKFYLFQFTGLKNHKLMIKAIAKINQTRKTIKGLFIGGQWGNKTNYEDKLRRKAKELAHNNIFMPGKVPPWEAHKAWNNLDLALHIPNSENCGGVLEPVLSGIPVLCSKTGGLPEVIVDGVTGYTLEHKTEDEIINKITYIKENYDEALSLTQRAQKLVKVMFDVKRTAKEIEQIYFHILGKKKEKPEEFNSLTFIQENQS